MQKINVDSEWVIDNTYHGHAKLRHHCSFVTNLYHTYGSKLIDVLCGDCNVRCPKETIEKFLFIVEDL